MATAILSISALPSPTTSARAHLPRTTFSKTPFALLLFSSKPVFRICSRSPASASLSKKVSLRIQLSENPLELQTPQPISLFVRKIIVCALVSSVCFISCKSAFATTAADDSIRASYIGLRVATTLRSLGWADELVVFVLAVLPVLELRGAIPVGYWMHLHPFVLTLLAVLGNMVPVPIILLYLKKLATHLSQKNTPATNFLDLLFKRAKEKAGPIEEFQWLGLMLFVAVPFPGTGAWTGSFIAAILDMPFWYAVSANFFGVVFAALLVNLLVNLGIKYAVLVGFFLFFLSTVMWSVMRKVRRRLGSR